jgi:hypothetical protein
MADLPGILKDVKELNNKYSYEPTSHILDFNIDPNLDVNGNVDDTLSDTCPPLAFSPGSLDSLDFFNDLQPIDMPYPPPSTRFQRRFVSFGHRLECKARQRCHGCRAALEWRE